MNKHVKADDFSGSPFKLLAAPVSAFDFARLAEIQMAAHAIEHYIVVYRSIPAHPGVADYRDRALALVNEGIADMRKVLSDG